MNPACGRLRSTVATLAVLAALSAVALAGCGITKTNNSLTQIGAPPYLEGSGKTASQTRSPGDFHAVSVDSAFTVTIKHGSAGSVTVTADDNLVPVITTEIHDGTLVLDVSRSISTHNSIKIAVTAASLDSIAQTAASTLDVEDVRGDALTVATSAASTLHAGGKVTSLTLSVDSASTADLRNIEARTATVHVGSASTVHVNVSESVTGDCGEASTLLVNGPATIDVDHDTSSTVKHE